MGRVSCHEHTHTHTHRGKPISNSGRCRLGYRNKTKRFRYGTLQLSDDLVYSGNVHESGGSG